MHEKVLVVDDEKSIVDIVKFNLEKEGYQVLTAGDGREGLEQFEQNNPDLILLDVMMPIIGGCAERCGKKAMSLSSCLRHGRKRWIKF